MFGKSRSSSSSAADALVCPACATGHREGEDFCLRCGMPLVRAGSACGEEPVGEAAARARKIRPEYTRGDLVRVAGGRNQAEAELIQNLLLEEGVPSMLRRSAGFDVPDFLAAGPRDVMVAASGEEAAREILLEADLAPSESAAGAPTGRRHVALLLGGLVGGGLVATGIAWLLMQISG